MFKQQGKVGAIRRNVRGRACVSCGSRNYQLVLRSLKQPQLGKLFARCSQNFEITTTLRPEQTGPQKANTDRAAHAVRKRSH